MNYITQAVEAGASMDFNSLRDQMKTYNGDFSGDVLIETNTSVSVSP
jgi:hypothetical protein